MIVGLLLKNWRLILDAIIIVAVIIFIFLWNPFNFFGFGLKLHNTANIVSNVKSINQLVTAEYYGEVISSLKESNFDLFQKNTLKSKAEKEYVRIKNVAFREYSYFLADHFTLEEIRKNGIEIRNRLITAINSFKQSLKKDQNDLTDAVMFFVAQNILNRNIDLDDFDDTQDRKEVVDQELDFLFLYLKNRHSKLSSEDFNNFLTQGFDTGTSFTNYYYKLNDLDVDGGKQLVIVGRGWVKAGFDFGKIDERRFAYDAESKTVHMFGIYPKILDTDINPWYIPERKIPGFDIILDENADFDDAKKVKEYCIRKLEINAINADILNKAKLYGEESIKELFTLLTGEEILAVFFHSDELMTIEDEISKDTLVTHEEINLIDSLYSKYKAELSSIKDNRLEEHKNFLLTQFLTNLKKLNLSGFSPPVKFNLFTKNLYKLGIDSVITTKEFSFIQDSLRWVMQNNNPFIPQSYYENNHWFTDSLEYINDYNHFVNAVADLYGNLIYKLLRDSIKDVKTGDPKYLRKVKDLVVNKGYQEGNILNYYLKGDLIEFDKIEQIQNVNYDTLSYLIQLDQKFIPSAVRSDSFYTKYNINKMTADSSKIVSLMQEKDLKLYYLFLESKNNAYQKKTWINKASESFRENFLNKTDYKKTSVNIRKRFEGIRKYFVE